MDDLGVGANDDAEPRADAVRVGVVGSGNQARLNLYPALQAAGARIAGIAARSISSAGRAAAFAPDAALFDDYRAMVSTLGCEGVVVCAQPRDQYEIVLGCIAAGCDVFVEKPLGWTPTEAERVAQAAEQAGVRVMVGFMKRYAPAYRRLRDVVRSGELGSPRSFRVAFAADAARFCATVDGFVKAAAIHVIDMVRAIFGEVTTVSGFQQTREGSIELAVALAMESGVLGTLSLSSATAWSREPEVVSVTGAHGFAELSGLQRLTVHTAPNESPAMPFADLAERDMVYTPTDTPMSGPWRDLYLRGFVGEMTHFLDCLRHGTEPWSNARDNVATMALCDRIVALPVGG